MNVSLNFFKVKPLAGVTEAEKLRKENAILRQLVDAGMLASDPSGLKKRHPRPVLDDEQTYKPTGFGLTTP